MSNDVPDLAATLTELVRTMADKPELEETLRLVTAAAVDLIEGAESADILLISKRKEFRSHAPTSDLPVRLDSIQEELGEGPSIDAAFDERIIHSDDLTAERRWPHFLSAGHCSRGSQQLVVPAVHRRRRGRCAQSVQLYSWGILGHRHRSRPDARHPRSGRLARHPQERTVRVCAGQPRCHRSGQGNDHGALRC